MGVEWRDIDDFPTYAVNDRGEILNKYTGCLLAVRQNQRGVVIVGLVLHGKQHMKSVNVIVASAFLNEPEQSFFNNLINLDGDRNNNSAVNLMWRPLWFVREYHQQFKKYSYEDWKVPIMLVDTGEVFANPRQAAIAYGLLEKDIRLDLINQRGVPPYGFIFKYMSE